MDVELGETRTSKRNLSLLPLIDVIFLLLIFFMFSSNLSPFSMLQLTRDRNEPGPEIQASESAEPAASVGAGQIDVMVMVSANTIIRINGRRIEAGALQSELEVLRASGAETLVVVPSRDASVQGLVTVLEAARQSAIPTVAIRQ